jgi:hypothetical protein
MPNIALSCEIGSGVGDGQCEDAIFNEAIERAERCHGSRCRASFENDEREWLIR